MVVPPVVPPPLLPCPAEAGWEVAARARLPRRAANGQPSGGFSAASYQSNTDTLLLLSDDTQGSVSAWSGVRQLGRVPLRPLFRLDLKGSPQAPLPAEMDGEGLVVLGDRLWVASEGRRSTDRPAQLLVFDRASGQLERAYPLPPDWQPAPGKGLGANKGPESLALLRRPGQADRLLMAAESPLLQDPPGQVRLLGWALGPSGAVPGPLARLAIPAGTGWGLTDLLVVDAAAPAPGLLALLRRYQAPDQWQILLAHYPLPDGRADPNGVLEPIHQWDLIAAGLPPDNWEALTPGPTQADGRASLLLASDDNFNAKQDNHVALLVPHRSASCQPNR
ncbi:MULTISPECIES: esterase-like activity of phytase family protein [unclassified Cyanobium]|uniref:esterase-like activity of phytase family protein n=1 Tax=unclassified Cyanobium TaxID=2627006 RepID=UPI0020CCDCBF|nr:MULTISPECIES: esterase-like activity of phytase family protein [unclassified Cyanobium]MCP9835299.1 esterase-like activity of phytase family protein [Cyanobium sp. La Preciosa 7G6]MCP9938065.1 esterase-like activity of phytase family protein [Cyanobium sp. Aljojuca 7A6]